MNPRRMVPLVAAVLVLAATPAAASADVAIAELSRDTPISARGGTVAWSQYDAATQRYRLLLKMPGTAPALAPIRTSATPFDVSLGADRKGRTVALYTRCAPGCDVYRHIVGGGGEQRVASVSAPDQDEAWPVQSGNLLAFVRRGLFGAPGGRFWDCDMPYVKRLGSRRPSRALDRGSCGRTNGLSLRGRRIAQVTLGTPPGRRRYVSQVRLLSVSGGPVRVLADRGFGEQSDVFTSVDQSAAAVWTTRTGAATAAKFVRIDIATGTVSEVRAGLKLAGALARDERGTFWYVEAAADRGCAEQGPVPCRLVRASAGPFSGRERVLPPVLTISAPSDRAPGVLYGDPFALSGRLTRTVVRRGEPVRVKPLGGVALQVLRRVDRLGPPRREEFQPTAIFATTSPDGSWSVPVPEPPARRWFSAVTRGPGIATYAGRGTGGAVNARVVLTRG